MVNVDVVLSSLLTSLLSSLTLLLLLLVVVSIQPLSSFSSLEGRCQQVRRRLVHEFGAVTVMTLLFCVLSSCRAFHHHKGITSFRQSSIIRWRYRRYYDGDRNNNLQRTTTTTTTAGRSHQIIHHRHYFSSPYSSSSVVAVQYHNIYQITNC